MYFTLKEFMIINFEEKNVCGHFSTFFLYSLYILKISFFREFIKKSGQLTTNVDNSTKTHKIIEKYHKKRLK